MICPVRRLPASLTHFISHTVTTVKPWKVLRMMDNKDLEAEIHPLKNEDKKSQENLGNLPKNEDALKSKPVPSRLSRCRTVAFFLSLFICLFVVFVLSFIIPCPDRPSSQGTWRLDYNDSGEPAGRDPPHWVPALPLPGHGLARGSLTG